MARRKRGASGRGRSRTSAQAMDTLNFLHTQTLLTTSQEGYTSTQAFNDKQMAQPLHKYVFPDGTQPIKVADPAPKIQQPENKTCMYSALDSILDTYRQQMLGFLQFMQSPRYKEQLRKDIETEKERNLSLKSRMSQLDKQITNLQKDSISALKTRLNELGINANTPAEFLAKAKEIVLRHKELDLQASALQATVSHLEGDHQKLMIERQHLFEQAMLNNKLNGSKNGIDQSQVVPELLMKDFALSMNQRRHIMDTDKKPETEIPITNSNQVIEKQTTKALEKKALQDTPTTVASPSPSSAQAKVAQSKTTPPKVTSMRKQRQDAGLGGRGGTSARANKEKLKESAVETFDSRLKSIITNALIGESSCPTSTTNFTHATNSVPSSAESQMAALRSRLDASLGVPSTSKGILTGKNSAKETLNLNQVLAGPTHCDRSSSSVCNPPVPPAHIDYTQISPAKMALKKHFRQDPSGHPQENLGQEERSAKSGASGGHPGHISLPVKIPLNEVSTKSSSKNTPTTSSSHPLTNSLTVSLPLASGQDSGHGAPHPHLTDQHAVHHHHRSGHKPEEGSSKGCPPSQSPVTTEAYSPISRPSSSSSTASAESVRHLSHGAHCVSPRNNSSSFNMDGTLSENSRSPGRAGQPTPPFSAANMVGPNKEALYGQALALHAKQSAMAAAAAAASYPGIPQMAHLLGMNMDRGMSPRFGLPGGERELKDGISAASAAGIHHPQLSPGCSKQSLTSQESVTHTVASARASPSQPYYRFPPAINGLTKVGAVTSANPVDEKPRRGRRKRQSSKSPSNIPPGKKAVPIPPPSKAEDRGRGKESSVPGNNRLGGPGAADIDSMVSNARKPLGISAISDAESSARSSPLASSSPMKPTNGPPQREVPVHDSDITRLKESPNQGWQMLSTGFDALLGFASTELERGKEQRRKSLETEPAAGASRSPGSSQPHLRSQSPRGNSQAKLGQSGTQQTEIVRKSPMENSVSSDSNSIQTSQQSKSMNRVVSPAPGSPLSASSSVESSHKGVAKTRRGEKNRVPSPESHRSRSRTRSRSRSRSRSPSGDPDSESEDKYSKYDKHFKKKFFGRDYNWKKQSTQRYAAETPARSGSKFKPKGKDWNHRGLDDKDRSSSPASQPPKLSPEPPTTNNPPNRNEKSDPSTSSTSSSVSESTKQGPGFYTPVSSSRSSTSSPATRTSVYNSSSGVSDVHGAQPSFTSAGLRPVKGGFTNKGTPPPPPHNLSPSGPPALSAQGPVSFAPSSSPPNLRSLDQPPRLTLSTPQGPNMQNHINMVRHLTPEMARNAALSHFGRAGHHGMPQMLHPGADARHFIPMMDMGGPRPAFPHGFRPQLPADMGGPRGGIMGEMMAHRPTFGGDPAIGVQRAAMFHHLGGRAGKDKNWKNFGNGTGGNRR